MLLVGASPLMVVSSWSGRFKETCKFNVDPAATEPGIRVAGVVRRVLSGVFGANCCVVPEQVPAPLVVQVPPTHWIIVTWSPLTSSLVSFVAGAAFTPRARFWPARSV